MNHCQEILRTGNDSVVTDSNEGSDLDGLYQSISFRNKMDIADNLLQFPNCVDLGEKNLEQVVDRWERSRVKHAVAIVEGAGSDEWSWGGLYWFECFEPLYKIEHAPLLIKMADA